jgi:iron-sulfur cluster repair protein YtfE (RIC family)
MSKLKDQSDVLDKIIQEHAALRHKLGRIHTVLAEPAPAQEEIEALLREFSNTLVAHFAKEEEDGFFDEIVSRAPQLADQAGKLRVEHRHLVHDITQLLQFASAGSPSMPWWRELSSRCHVLSKKLMQHESDEGRLMQRAFHEEVAAGIEICS